jgi:hypothetical protein
MANLRLGQRNDAACEANRLQFDVLYSSHAAARAMTGEYSRNSSYCTNCTGFEHEAFVDCTY